VSRRAAVVWLCLLLGSTLSALVFLDGPRAAVVFLMVAVMWAADAARGALERIADEVRKD
jgi:hypothetical protein